MDKKKEQLGMNPGTASHRLVKDILFRFVQESGCKCYHCGIDLTRDTFSIEHIDPWLDSDDPVGRFFDLDNIAFSHLSCNAGAARKIKGVFSEHGDVNMYEKHGCRCCLCKEAKFVKNSKRTR